MTRTRGPVDLANEHPIESTAVWLGRSMKDDRRSGSAQRDQWPDGLGSFAVINRTVVLIDRGSGGSEFKAGQRARLARAAVAVWLLYDCCMPVKPGLTATRFSNSKLAPDQVSEFKT